jgi:hypothetical protein
MAQSLALPLNCSILAKKHYLILSNQCHQRSIVLISYIIPKFELK